MLPLLPIEWCLRALVERANKGLLMFNYKHYHCLVLFSFFLLADIATSVKFQLTKRANKEILSTNLNSSNN